MRAVAAAPDDDTPRLVIADWLQEHGEDEWAEFIRLQLGRHGTQADHDPIGLSRRESELLRGHRKRTLAGLPVWVGRDGTTFHRGMPDVVRIKDVRAFLGQADEPWRSLPTAVGISVRRQAPWPAPPERFFESGHLRHVRRLDLAGCRFTRAMADALTASPHADGLWMIDLSGVVWDIPDPRRSREALYERFGHRIIFG